MKTKILLTAVTLMLAAASSARADVLIYRMLETTRTIGYDRNKPGTASGYLVIDWDSGEMRILRARNVYGNKQFTVCRREFKRRIPDEVKRRHIKASNFPGFPARYFEVEMEAGILPRTVAVDDGSG
jgi:hypothetical protein